MRYEGGKGSGRIRSFILFVRWDVFVHQLSVLNISCISISYCLSFISFLCNGAYILGSRLD